jgi:DNA processing protein
MFMDRESAKSLDRKVRLAIALSSVPYSEKERLITEHRAPYDGCAAEKEASEALGLVKKTGARVTAVGDPDYPEQLYMMESPPMILYYRGDLSVVGRPCIAVVGSRDCSEYGRFAARMASSAASRCGACIVSGGARGADTEAHLAALYNEGKTACILGCGVDVAYPAENRRLFNSIAENGVIISEYPPGFKPKKWTFPMRNRIIAALASAVVVTEAKDKSGSLHTAAYAEEWNRRVYAVPGDIRSEGSMGVHQLIQMGARLLSHPSELASDLISFNPECIGWRMEDIGLLGIPVEKTFVSRITGMQEDVIERHIFQSQKSFSVEPAGDSRIIFRKI